jgi:hypothetical protein
MIFGFWFRLSISAAVLYVALYILSRGRSRPGFLDVFYAALAIGFVATLLFYTLFPRIGYYYVLPSLAAQVLILVYFCRAGITTAIIVAAFYQLLLYLIGL